MSTSSSKEGTEAQRTCGVLLKIAIALQVLLLVRFLLSVAPHSRISTEHQKRTAQRHWGGNQRLSSPEELQVPLDETAGNRVPSLAGAKEHQQPQELSHRAAEEEEKEQQEGPGTGAVRRCMGAPNPWDPLRWREAAPDGPAEETRGEPRRLIGTTGRRRALLREAPEGGGALVRSAAWKEKQRLKERETAKKARAEKAAAQALEDEKTSVGPRNSWCERESQGAEHVPSMTDEERLLASCITRPRECSATPSVLRRIASSSLEGFRKLDDDVACIFANGMLCPINTTARNKETGYTYQSVPFDLPLPDRDSAERFRSCAVVGNGGSVMTSNLNGAAIDAHEAVFRFNDMLRLSCLDPDNPNAVLCQEPGRGPSQSAGNATGAESDRRKAQSMERLIADQDNKYRPFIGRRTTFRVLNKKHALKLQALGRSAPAGRPRFRPADSEAFLLWHHSSVAQGSELARQFPDNRIFFFSADLVNWQVDTYSALRRGFYSLGLGPMPCYSALSSGIHGILLALRLCESVSLMGFSLDLGSVKGPVHFRPIFERPSEAHSWNFDVVLLRLLHMTGRVTVCSA